MGASVGHGRSDPVCTHWKSRGASALRQPPSACGMADSSNGSELRGLFQTRREYPNVTLVFVFMRPFIYVCLQERKLVTKSKVHASPWQMPRCPSRGRCADQCSAGSFTSSSPSRSVLVCLDKSENPGRSVPWGSLKGFNYCMIYCVLLC